MKVMFLSLLLSVPTAQSDKVMQLYEASTRYYESQKYDSAVIVGEQALPLLQQKGMKAEEAEELSILSVCCMRQSDYDKALRYAKACNELERKNGDAERISSSLNTIGSIYVAAKQPKEGLTTEGRTEISATGFAICRKDRYQFSHRPNLWFSFRNRVRSQAL